MTRPLIAGIDCSTQATKAVVVDVEDGTVVGAGRSPHRVEGSAGARETDPADWWGALASALAQTGRAGDVGAIAVAGQQHGLVVVDRDAEPLRPAILWNDTRAAEDARWLVASLGPERWAQLIGSVPVASFTIASWAWLRRAEPATAAATRSIRLPHDWLTQRLCGRGVTDRGDASGTGWWSPALEGYVADVLELQEVRLDEPLLPEVLGPGGVAGEVTPAAAAELGLRAGTIVGPGTGDNMGAALGLGLEPGTAVMSLGTSGTVFTVSSRPAADPSGVVAGFADATGRFLPLACTLNCTLAVDRVAQWLGIGVEDVADRTSVVVLPYLDGERTPNLPNASGTISGLRHATEPGEILLAAYEGAVASLLDALDALDAHSSGIDADAPLVMVGGGARGRAWRSVVARLSGRRLRIPAAEESVALGAAAQAAALLSGEAADAVARRWDTQRGEVIDPVPHDEEAVARIRSVREAVEPIM